MRKGRYTKSRHIYRSNSRLRRAWIGFWRLSLKKKLLVIGIPILAFLILVPLVTYALLWRDISDPERLMNRNNTGIELLDSNGEVFYSSGTSKPLKRLKLTEMSTSVKDAVVSSEDKDFYKHSGVSIKGLVAALYANFSSHDATAYGGSTITQQLVKNTLLTSNKNFFRKYQEVVMAVAVDRQYSKDEILDMYINSVYFGEGAFGIDEAAHVYFAKDAKDLTLAESSMLIGVLPAPSAYSPVSGDAEKAKKQQERVLRRMVEDKKISEADKAAALAVVLSYAPPKQSAVGNAPHFVEMVIAELENKYGDEAVERSGYRVRTTLNLAWQKTAEKNVADQTAINARSGGRNAALVAIDPKNGEIRALVGSADYNNDQWGKFNVAINPRQPGSSFKPIYFTEALNQRVITPGMIMRDEATDFGGYTPHNFDHRYRGDISVRNALSQSLNIPAVKVMEKIGVSSAVDTAQRMGLSTISHDQDYGLSLALGAAEVEPLKMTNAYAAFANGGQQYTTTTIQEIENKYGEVVYRHNPVAKRVQSEQASYLISNILSDNSARAPTFGSSLNISGRNVAVKTGSTDNNHDAWTIGYTPSLVVGVWVGNNENEAMSSGGSAMAGPIWRKSITAFLDGTNVEEFVRPSGIVEASICRSNGFRATGNATNTYNEVFLSGTVPTESCGSNTPPPSVDEEDTQPQTANNDTDGDGVKDNKDLCPNTPAGTPVTANGCTKVVTVDTDKDGVADDIDLCPSTPLIDGKTVDSNGCYITVTDPTPIVPPPTQ
ncbi:MAG: PBP1A family penicillin-binding protein [Candidatus Saccharimonadales bacterium]|jgi:penicillin-binding protein 1A